MLLQHEELKRKICSLNNAQLGSYGEYIFRKIAKSVLKGDMQSLHDMRVDFIVNGMKIDVKTSRRNIASYPRKLKTYNTHRVDGVSYALVELFSDEVRISIEGRQISVISWREASELWDEWKGRGYKHRILDHKDMKRKKLAPMQREIAEFFQPLGISTRIIYRTSQKDWGNESPHNLKPSSKKEPTGLTIFLDFIDSNISRDNFRQIVCFLNVRADELPMVKKIYLHKPKVDLKKLPEKFLFKDINDLKRNYRRVFE